jgi:hypothetical protein
MSQRYLLPIQTILVPQGAEYKAVCRGLSRTAAPKPLVLAIPIGSKPLAKCLEMYLQAGHFLNYPQPRVLVMGLCGSLSPDYAIGDIGVYQECIYDSNEFTSQLQSCNATEELPRRWSTDLELTTWLYDKLKERASLVRAITSDRLIFSAEEKRFLGQRYNAQVVDMEGFAALEVLTQAGVAVAMVRAISDDSHHNLPSLSSAISPDGSLQPLPLAIGMLRQPVAATRLIRGSIHGLQALQQSTTLLFIE